MSLGRGATPDCHRQGFRGAFDAAVPDGSGSAASAQVVVLWIANIPFSLLSASHQYHQLAMLEQPSHFKYS